MTFRTNRASKAPRHRDRRPRKQADGPSTWPGGTPKPAYLRHRGPDRDRSERHADRCYHSPVRGLRRHQSEPPRRPGVPVHRRVPEQACDNQQPDRHDPGSDRQPSDSPCRGRLIRQAQDRADKAGSRRPVHPPGHLGSSSLPPTPATTVRACHQPPVHIGGRTHPARHRARLGYRKADRPPSRTMRQFRMLGCRWVPGARASRRWRPRRSSGSLRQASPPFCSGEQSAPTPSGGRVAPMGTGVSSHGPLF